MRRLNRRLNAWGDRRPVVFAVVMFVMINVAIFAALSVGNPIVRQGHRETWSETLVRTTVASLGAFVVWLMQWILDRRVRLGPYGSGYLTADDQPRT